MGTTPKPKLPFDRKLLTERLHALGYSIKEVSEGICVSERTFRRWLSAEEIPEDQASKVEEFVGESLFPSGDFVEEYAEFRKSKLQEAVDRGEILHIDYYVPLSAGPMGCAVRDSLKWAMVFDKLIDIMRNDLESRFDCDYAETYKVVREFVDHRLGYLEGVWS